MKKALLLTTVTILLAIGLQAQEWSFGNDPVNFPINAGIPAGTTVTINGLAITAGTSPTNMGQVEASSKTFGATTYQNRFKFNGGGYSGAAATDVTPTVNMPTQRYISFPVSGNSTIRVHGLTGSNGSDRKLFITNGTNFIGSIDMLGTALTEEKTFTYTGPAATLYMFCNAAINLYNLKVSAIAPPAPPICIENFNFPDNSLLSANGWVAHSGGGTAPIAVGASNGLIYPGYSGITGVTGVVEGNAAQVFNNGEDDSKTFTPITSGTLYFSFLTKITSGTAGYYIHLGGSSSAFAARFFVKPSSVGGKINFGISNTSTGIFAATPTDFDLGTTYLIFIKYNVSSTGAVSMWVKSSGVPATEAAAGTPEVSASGTGQTSIDRVALRQYSTAQRMEVDGIRLGQAWADITTAAPPAAIHLTAPVGGESFDQGTAHNITWTADNFTGTNIKIELLGANASIIAASVPVSAGTYNWFIPKFQPKASDYRVKISDVADPTVSNTSGTFSIVAPTIQITEIMYNPPDAGNDSLEFIELYNQGTKNVNLKGWYFSKGITYTFPDTTLAPGKFYVVATSAYSMKVTFGIKCAEWPVGFLDDDGETIELSDALGQVKDTVHYLPGPPWPVGANNGGHSISMCNLNGNNEWYGSWSATKLFANVNAIGDSIWASPGKDCTLPIVKAAFLANKTIQSVDGMVQFTDQTTNGPVSWQWSFPGGTPSTSTEKNPLIQYKQAGTYSVSLKVKNLYGSDSISMVNYILIVAGSTNAFTFTQTEKVYDELFDGMGPTGTSYLLGWTGIRYGGTGTVGATLTMIVSDGSGNSGGVYNAGTIGAGDRALGALGSGSTYPRFGASFFNGTNASITKIDMKGVMEQWRSGSNNTVTEVTPFEYSLDATDLSSGTWVAVTDFDLVEKLTTTTVAAAVNGNAPENKTALTATIDGITWTPNSTMWIRWSDPDNLGSDGLYAIDSLKMSVTTGATVVDPKPTNYPSAFTATEAGLGISTQWTDAIGAQLPAGYLVKISKNSTIAAPVDGTYTTDDLDLSDGNGAKNISKGIQQYTFTGLDPSTLYFVKIFPYTNAGTIVDYKTDGTVPAASATTQSKIHVQNFDGSPASLFPWTEFSVTGDQIWAVDSTHGVNSTKCAKMSGYLAGNLVNEDWLISPSFSFVSMTNVKLQFQSAFNYDGTPLLLLVSTDYTGGNPSTSGTWTDITSQAVFSAGGWVWTPSGIVNLNTAGQANVHIAFKYTSDASNARTWEIDDVLITANSTVGLSPKAEAIIGKIYPNPASNFFQVQLPDNGDYRIRILNAQGAVVKTLLQTDRNSKIFTNGMRSGLYFVVIENLINNKTEVHKLTVK